MTRSLGDGCGCFPTGRHYPGIAHLLKVSIRGLAEAASARQARRLEQGSAKASESADR